MRLDPNPYVAVYGVIVFFLPWAIYGGYVLRATFYVEYHSISREQFADPNLREQILREHPQLAHWYRQSIRWRTRLIKIWLVGFFALAGSLFLLVRFG